MTAIYNMAIEAILGVLELMAQKKPVAGEPIQQALLNVEIALDRASSEPAEPDAVAKLMHLRQQLLTATKYTYYAQPCQY